MPIGSKADYDLVKSELAAEYAKPADKQDIGFMNEAIKQLQGAQQFAVAQSPAAPALPLGEQIKRTAIGAGDVALSSVNHLINDNAARVAGVGGLLTGQDYDTAKNMYAMDHPAYDPTTEEGQALAAGLQKGAADFGLPQVMQLTKKASEAVLGKTGTDLATGALELATMKTPGKSVPTLPGELALAKARADKFIIPPATPLGGGKYAGTTVDRAAAGMAGTADIENAISMKNEQRASQLAAKDAQLPEGTVTPGGVARATDGYNAAYDAIKAFDVPVQLPLPQYQPILDRIKKLADNTNPLRGAPDPEILALQQRLLKANGATVPDFIDMIRELRSDSFANAQAATTAGGAKMRSLAKAQRQAADILDDSLDAFLHDTATSMKQTSPAASAVVGKLYSDYRQARQGLSTLHVIRDSMNPQTGAIDASEIAKAGETTKLTPGLQSIKDAYDLNPKAFRPVEQAARTAGSPISRVDVISMGFGGTAAAGGFASGHPGYALASSIAATAPMALRLLSRAYALRGNAARAVQTGVGMGARGAARALTLEQQLEEQPQ